MKRLFILAILFCFSALWTNAQEDIRVKQDGKDIIIEYDLEKEATNVKLYVSTDNGQNFKGPMEYVSGDIENVMAGKNKQIRWNVIKEWGGLKGNVSFKLEKKYRKYYHTNSFFLLNGAISPSPQYSYGLIFGRVKRIGWYGSVQIEPNFKLRGDYECNKDGYINVNGNDILPFYSGEKTFSRIAINAGGVIRFGEPVYLYGGIGYGQRNTFWELLDEKWVKNKGLSYSGVNLELGLIFKIKNFVFSTGISSIQADYLDFKIGIGWNFKSKNAK